VKLAVVLFNLGGPDTLANVEPYLRNLFSDRAIIDLPSILRLPLARLIASRRAPVARQIYGHMGGGSPIVPETEAQARALESALAAAGHEARCFIAMRCWHPFTSEAITAVKAYQPEHVVLLPLYPQFSTTTSQSSLKEWSRQSRQAGLAMPAHEVCCYPFEDGFVDAAADLLDQALHRAKSGIHYRVLFSAHGLPKRVVDRGDPYQWQVERTVEAIIARCKTRGLDYSVCYQSRVGPLEWIGPATDAEVRRAGAERTGLTVMPVAFVSEHSETLVELDIEYARLAEESGAPDYIRVPAVRTHPAFINGLAQLVLAAVGSKTPVTCAAGRICPPGRTCGHERVPAHV